jgi:hypothetical protein
MYVANDVSLNGGLFLSGDASFNSNLKVGNSVSVYGSVNSVGGFSENGIFLNATYSKLSGAAFLNDVTVNGNLNATTLYENGFPVTFNRGVIGLLSSTTNATYNFSQINAGDIYYIYSAGSNYYGNVVLPSSNNEQTWFYLLNAQIAGSRTFNLKTTSGLFEPWGVSTFVLQPGSNALLKGRTDGGWNLISGNYDCARLAYDNTFTGKINGLSDASFNGNLKVGSRMYVANDVSLNGRLFLSGDASFNGNLVMSGNLYTTDSGEGWIGYSGNSRLSNNNTETQLGANTNLRFYTGTTSATMGTEKMTLIQNGNVGIGNTTPAYTLDITGKLRATGTATAASFNATSDRRLKTNIEPLSSQWNNIKLLQPAQYKWIYTSKTDHGFIAQDVYKLYPDMQTQFELDPSNNEFPTDYSGNPLYYTLDYSKMTPYLWKGLQEAIHTIEKQQTQIDTQQTQIDDLIEKVRLLTEIVSRTP